MRTGRAFLLGGALVLTAVAARAGDGPKAATGAGPKTPPSPTELPVERTIPVDPLATGGTMEGGPRVLAFSPDGKTLAIGNQDGQVSVVDLPEPGSDAALPDRRPLARHLGAVAGVAFVTRGDRKLLVSVGDDGMAFAAAVGSGTPALKDEAPLIRRALGMGPLTGLAVLDAGPEDPRLVATSVRGTLTLLGVGSEMTQERTLDGSREAIVQVVALGRDRAAFAGWDGFVRLFDLKAGKELRSARVAAVELTALAATPDRKVFAVGSWKKGVALLDAATLKPLGSAAEPHRGCTFAAVLSGTGGGGIRGLRLVTASIADETVVVSEPFEDRLVPVLRTKLAGVPSALAASEDGSRLAVAGFDGTITLYKLPPRAEVKPARDKEARKAAPGGPRG